MIAALGFALFTRPALGGSYWTTFFPAVVVLGLGMAVSVAPLTTTVMNSVERSRAGVASGVNNAVSRIAGLVAIAALGLVMLHAFDRSLDRVSRRSSSRPRRARRSTRNAPSWPRANAPAGLAPETTRALERALDESFVAGFRRVLWWAAGLALASALVAWRSIPARARVRGHDGGGRASMDRRRERLRRRARKGDAEACFALSA
jgi:predicted MFS family arabinose efflux permease